METKGLIEKCLFHSEGICYLNESYPSECKLCFNFVTVYDIGKSKNNLTTLFDYLKSVKKIEDVFPTGQSTQRTL